MEPLRQYVLSIAVAAILCGLVLSMAPKGQFQGILKLVCGVFLALLVIEPVTRLDPSGLLFRFRGDWQADGAAAAAFGEEAARDATSSYIKQESEAYILDKARDLGFSLDVDVSVGEDDLPLPEVAVIRGSMPESVRRELAQLIEENLGIAKENLQWIG